MRIITISREFGSGGRELGKRMSDLLGWDYYDREIISRIARERGLDEDYVDRMLTQRPWQGITIGRSFGGLQSPGQAPSLLGTEKTVIERIAAQGRDCIIVGRNADVYLQKLAPFSLFVCADKQAKLQRCRDRARPEEHLTDRELERKIREIDRARKQIREFVGGNPWGDPASYCLTVNTTGWQIKELAPVAADFAKRWFERERQGT